MIVRRWFVVLPVLLLVVAIGYHESGKVTRKYEARADELLLPPPDTVPGHPTTGWNPFTSPDLLGAPLTVGEALQATMDSDQTDAALSAYGLQGTYDVTLLAGQVAMLETVADASTPEGALSVLRAVVRTVGAELNASQDAVHAPTTQRITLEVVNMPTSASLVTTSNTHRILAATAAVALAASIGVAFLAEGIATRRPEGLPA
jgi:hypothetical protein